MEIKGYYHDASDEKMAEEFQYVNSKDEGLDKSEFNNAILNSPFRKALKVETV